MKTLGMSEANADSKIVLSTAQRSVGHDEMSLIGSAGTGCCPEQDRYVEFRFNHRPQDHYHALLELCRDNPRS